MSSLPEQSANNSVRASVSSLRVVNDADEENEKSETLIDSTKSLNAHQSESLKCLVPQILASLAAASFHIGNGISIAFSAVLISQLDQPDSDFHSSNAENAFMASVITLVAPFASVINGFFMDKVGRILTIKTAIVPGILGWTCVALAPNMDVVIAGRIIVGISSVWGSNPAIVYTTEITNPKIRMSLMQLGPVYVALGMIFTYLGGWYLHWRTVAWASNVFIGLAAISVFFIHESPAWLILQGKYKEANKSLHWLHKYQPIPPGRKEETFAEIKFKLLKKQQEQEELNKETKKGALKGILNEFLKPTGYKPLVIMCPLFFCQHFSGIFITMFYSITFIHEAGSDFNAYYASAFIGVIRFVMAIFNVFILKYVNRRTAIIISCAGMAIFMYISGLYTHWIKEGATTATWVPVVSLLMYMIFSVTGLMFLPFLVISELFPLQIRGIGFTLGYSLSTVFMFGALQSYFTLNEALGGATNLQWFFALVSLVGMVYTYMFLPETRGKELKDISENFKEGWLYIGKSHREDNEESRENNV